MNDSTGAEEPPVTWVEIPSGQGVQVGDHGTQVNKFIKTYIERQVIQPRSAPVAGPVVAGDVPQSPIAFQPRAELLAALRESGPGVSVVRSVTGMRGVGKTQVAAAYARWCIDESWRLVAWINAQDTANVLSGLAMVAARLGISEPDARLEDVGALVRNRLEADGEQCLVVFDNLTDLDELRPFLPAAGRSQVVITSAGQSVASLGGPVPVDVFSEEESLAFLAQRTGRTDPAGAVELARELGHLPLALAQAAAVIAAQRLNYHTYLDRLRSLPVQEYLTPTAGEPYPHGVAQAVLMSLDAATATDNTRLCSALINVVSLLSPAGVPRLLLYATGLSGIFTEVEGEYRSADPHEVDDALGQLADASLLTFSVDGSTVSAHRLIMRVVRERCAHNDTLADLGHRTCALLFAITRSLDEPWQNRTAARNTVRQVIALNDHLAPRLGDDHAVIAKRLLGLRGWALRCMNELGDSAVQAVEYAELLIAEYEQVLGPGHPDTLAIRGNLAYAYQEAGRTAEAIPLLERLLADRERLLGDTHPDNLITSNNLASAYRAAGRPAEAIPLLERNLADRRQVFGDTHPSTLIVRDNLAMTYQAAGRLPEAIPLVERNLADREKVLGDTHPDTLMSRNNLGAAYEAAGRLAEAIPLLERTVADREQVLGDTHPDTLMSRDNLASTYQAAGRLAEAIALHERTVIDCEGVLGNIHPITLLSRCNLAYVYQKAGRLAEAIALGERTLTDREQVLGDTHPETLMSRNNLAHAYEAAGRLAEAIALYERTLTDYEQVLGDTHPSTLITPGQPRLRISGGWAAGGGHRPGRAYSDRPRTGPGRHPPRHPDRPRQPCHRLSGSREAYRGHPAV